MHRPGPAGLVVLTYDAIGQGERMVSGNIHHEAGYAADAR